LVFSLGWLRQRVIFFVLHKYKMKNITASKEIIPWTCHVCGGQFQTRGGGLCSRCNRATCRKHLEKIETKLRLESEWLCLNCINKGKTTEKKDDDKI